MAGSEVFFFDKGGPLLCYSIKRDGEKIRAQVVNGAWTMLYEPGKLEAYAGSVLMNTVATTIVRTVPIPSGMRGDYNALICWAESQPAPPSVAVLLEDFPYHYGPTATDPDPGKKWHIGCGGEVLFIEDGLICAKCGAQASLEG